MEERIVKVKIAIVGEFHKDFIPHASLNHSLDYLSQESTYSIEYNWIDTSTLEDNVQEVLFKYHGIWSAPGSPFKSLEGAVNAIQYAHEKNIPHLGTCAGFQHTVIEIARNMLGYEEAQHEEYNSASSQLFVNKLVCSLAGKTMKIQIKEETQAFRWYGKKETEENYYCNFGINPEFEEKLTHPELIISGVDNDGEIRIIEIKENCFFIATLFVPQSKATKENPHPIIKGFVDMACQQALKDIH
jgi:CTP synthase (UTP-ammonia lyase)